MYNTNAADGLLMKWYRKRLLLDRQLLEREQLQGQQAQLREEVAAALEAADRRLAELAQAEEQGQQAAAAEAAEAAEVGGPERSQQEEEPELGLRAKYSETEGRAQPAAAGAAEAPDSPARCWQRAPPTVQQQEARAARIKGKLEKVAARIAESEAGLADLQRQIEEAQQEAAEAQPAPCFFACFRTAHAAAYAARLNLNPLQQRMMR